MGKYFNAVIKEFCNQIRLVKEISNYRQVETLVYFTMYKDVFVFVNMKKRAKRSCVIKLIILQHILIHLFKFLKTTSILNKIN